MSEQYPSQQRNQQPGNQQPGDLQPGSQQPGPPHFTGAQPHLNSQPQQQAPHGQQPGSGHFEASFGANAQPGQQPNQYPGEQSGQQYPGQQYPGQQYPGQQYPGQPQHGQPQNGQPQYGGFQAAAPSAPKNTAATIRVIASSVAVVLVLAGLSIPESGEPLWVRSLAWSIFAAVAVIVHAIGSLTPGEDSLKNPLRVMNVAGGGGYLLYWVVIALPGVNSNAGFLLTIAAAAVAVGMWLFWRGQTDKA
ncbi:hypothetical protein [Humidisolicoccus flavus]|uniref:hypothetical protein n=1 Tax=Humidisolicoccus flavus TaxID=3111414 RepID=UPI003248585F